MSQLEDDLAFQMKAIGIPFTREYRFAPPRRWRSDFAILIPQGMLIEVEGGVFVNGRHSRGAGMLKDMEKYNAAAEGDWTVLRYGKQHINSGEAVAQINRMYLARL